MGSDSLGDDGFHQIFEALFCHVQIERAAYISSSKSSNFSSVANRLRDGATVFRLAVELGVRKVISRTVNAVIDHVLDTLPVAGQAYCLPLTDGYLKILRAVLGHAPHLEHIREKKWCSLVDFSIKGISHYALDENDPPSGSGTSILSLHTSGSRTTSFRVSQGSGSHPSQYDTGRPAEDLLLCLDSLTVVTNAPIMSKATTIVECIIGLLNSTGSSGLLHQVAFHCANNILPIIITEDSRLAQRFLLEILPAMRRLWSTKNTALRDEMLISLVLSSDIIQALPTTNPSDNVLSSLSNLIDAISSEYHRRNERDVLQLDEIHFTADPSQLVMTLTNFRARPENTRGTFNWCTISMLTLITLTVDRFPQMTQKAKANNTPGKRQRLENGLDEVFRQSLSGSSMIKIRALQMVPFLVDVSPHAAESFPPLIVKFSNQILDKDPTIASWTMVAISRYRPLLVVQGSVG